MFSVIMSIFIGILTLKFLGIITWSWATVWIVEGALYGVGCLTGIAFVLGIEGFGE